MPRNPTFAVYFSFDDGVCCYHFNYLRVKFDDQLEFSRHIRTVYPTVPGNRQILSFSLLTACGRFSLFVTVGD